MTIYNAIVKIKKETALYDARGAGIDESQSKFNVVIAQIGNYAKASYYLGKEFKKEVTNLSNIMYKNIISNTGPYRETSYWTSSYGDVKCHLHKDSEAYKFFSSKVYKDSIAFGKVTDIVMPLVSNVMTGYLSYKKYYTSVPNKYNNYFNPPKQLKIKNKQIGHKFSDHKKDYPEFKDYKEYKKYCEYVFKNHDKVIVDIKKHEFYYIKGKDLLRVKPNGEFVSLYPGADSPRVVNAIKAKGVLPHGY